MNTQRITGLLATIALALSSCSDSVAPAPTQPSESEHLAGVQVKAVVAKWYDDHAGAVTLTYDSGWPAVGTDNKVQMLAHGYGVKVDFELVTANFRKYEDLKSYLEHVIIPLDIGVFGHGDEHTNHDSMTYQQAYESFRRCYETMRDLGLKPVSYAYPGGMGFEQETWKALEDAGFLSGRSFHKGAYLDPYITPGNVMEPSNWYDLPTLVMEEYSVAQCEPCVGSAEELGSYLEETVKRTAWLMPTYHNIVDVGETGLYRISEFEKDLQQIAKRDLWSATFNEATLYVRERSKATVNAHWYKNERGDVRMIGIHLADHLPDDTYNQPLTVLVDIPPAWVGKTLSIFDGDSFVSSVVATSEHAKISVKPIDREYRITILRNAYSDSQIEAISK